MEVGVVLGKGGILEAGLLGLGRGFECEFLIRLAGEGGPVPFGDASIERLGGLEIDGDGAPLFLEWKRSEVRLRTLNTNHSSVENGHA